MNFIYNIGIYFAQLILNCLALFNQKIKLGVDGRKAVFSVLQTKIFDGDKTLWFHCASLGEYEQGLPVFKALKKQYPKHKIVLTFFSPSGYEIRKSAPIADVVTYLPLDSKKNVKQFLDIVNPELSIFVKYDIWPNYLLQLKKRKKRVVLISALFRENQSFFKFYGKLMRQALFSFEHIFVQDQNSKQLLESINYVNCSISGDTRFDRVLGQLNQDNTIQFVDDFKQNSMCVVAGSTWPEDENILASFINSNLSKTTKFIIAPHTIKYKQIQALKDSISVKTILYSEKEGKNLRDYSVLILDTIGILSKVYNYADIAYVGGAMGNTGLHNTLEAAVFGIPIIIGSNFEKFPEAKYMIANGGIISINNANDLHKILLNYIENPKKRVLSGSKNLEFIKKNEGAVVQIMDFLRK